ncbi:hypothetical protein NKG94_13350 [Micromonospora sp. M12]
MLWRDRALIPVALVVESPRPSPPRSGRRRCCRSAHSSASHVRGAVLPADPSARRRAHRRRPAGLAALSAPGRGVLRYLSVAYIFAYALGTGARARRAQAVAQAERDRRVAGEREAAVLRERTGSRATCMTS